MFLAYLVLFTALAISAVAIYYSVAGLVAIFASAAVAIIIMGSILEIAKLVTAVWLHKYWDKTVWWLKTYLSIAVIVLMLITSMGIFGFLSKAHIEQTANAQDGIAQIERINTDLAKQQDIISRAEVRIDKTVNSDNTRDSELQEQISLEQNRIDNALQRIQPAIDEQNQIITQETDKLGQRTAPLQAEVSRITTVLNDLQTAINSNDIAKAQGIVGTNPDGRYGPDTARAVDEFRIAQTQRRDGLVSQIDSLRSAPSSVAEAAREEIRRLRSLTEQQISASTTLLERLRSQLGQGDSDEVEQIVLEQRERITQANLEIDKLSDRKFELETEYRKLEAEVGPLKYIAEFVYGETADTDLLEEAVRWVIILIIFVFDPLAVLLLIASQYTFNYHRKQEPAVEEQPAEEVVEEQPVEVKDIVESLAYTLVDHTSEVEDDGDWGEDWEEDYIDPESLPIEYQDDAEDLEELRRIEYEKRDQKHLPAKEQWKKDHPDQTLKLYKNLFIQGKIDSLPWENYISDR